MTGNVEFDGGIPVDIEFVEFMIASGFPDDAVNYTPQTDRTEEEKAVARKNIGAMAAGIQRVLAINSADNDPNAGVHFETERRASNAVTLNLYSGDYETGAEYLTILSHLADGERDADAATVGQLKALAERFPLPNEKYFDIDYDGIVSLKPEYRGNPTNATYTYAVSDNGVGVNGSKIGELPEKLVIPDIIDGTAVAGFQLSMFQKNSRVKEITIPDTVTELPDRFCQFATNLRAIHNTEQVTKIGRLIISNTQVEKAIFPNLQEAGTNCFAAAYNLYVVDIGNVISDIPSQTFANDVRLSLVKGGGNVKTIGERAFYCTLNLKNLSFLPQVTAIGTLAFYQSRIQFDWSSIEGQCAFEDRATPVIDNKTDYWSNVQYTPCDNGVITTMQQTNPEWKDGHFGELTEVYNNCCHIFAILHIHSALSGKVYKHPDEFASEVTAIDPTLMTDARSTAYFENAAPFFNALGYKTTVYADDITKEIYQAICDALARGAYIYQQISTYLYEDSGHVVALYGINSNKEVLVLDSGCPSDVTLYRMPFQNLTGPSSNLVIVEKEA